MFTISCSEFDPEVCGIRYCISLVCGIRYSLNSILSLPFAVFDIDLRFLVWIRSWTLAIYGIRSVCGSELQFDLERLSFAVFDWFAVLVCGFHRPESELSRQQCGQKILRFWRVIFVMIVQLRERFLRFWKRFCGFGNDFAVLKVFSGFGNDFCDFGSDFCGFERSTACFCCVLWC